MCNSRLTDYIDEWRCIKRLIVSIEYNAVAQGSMGQLNVGNLTDFKM